MSPTITEWIADLTAKGDAPCDGARRWLATLPADATMSDAWAQCPRSDWMQWAAQRSPLKETDERWRLAGCAIIRRTPLHDGRTVWDLLTDERSRNAVEVAERFARGEASSEELASAYASAVAAAVAAAVAYASASAAVLREFIPDPWATQTVGTEKGEG